MVKGKILAEILKSEKLKEKFTSYITKFECVVFSRTNPN